MKPATKNKFSLVVSTGTMVWEGYFPQKRWTTLVWWLNSFLEWWWIISSQNFFQKSIHPGEKWLDNISPTWFTHEDQVINILESRQWKYLVRNFHPDVLHFTQAFHPDISQWICLVFPIEKILKISWYFELQSSNFQSKSSTWSNLGLMFLFLCFSTLYDIKTWRRCWVFYGFLLCHQALAHLTMAEICRLSSQLTKGQTAAEQALSGSP